MSKSMNLKYARFIKTILDIIFGALIVACVVLVVWILASPLLMGRLGSLGTASMLVRIELPNEDPVEVSTGESGISTVFIDDAEGTLFIETSNVMLVLVANLAKLFVGLGLVYVFKLLRSILKNIMNKTPFMLENTQFLYRLGYALLAITIFRPLIEYFAAKEILRNVQYTISLQPGFHLDLVTILVSLLILLLAFIWRYGLELEQDQALTV